MIINESKVKNKVKENGKEKNKAKKILQSFFFGGLVGIFAQAIFMLFNLVFNFDKDISITISSGLIIIIAVVLTCLGVFDKLACIARCGILIPISGFANSITSSALEGKSEGMIFGIGSKLFSLIGSVCTYGIVSSIILGFIYYFYRLII